MRLKLIDKGAVIVFYVDGTEVKEFEREFFNEDKFTEVTINREDFEVNTLTDEDGYYTLALYEIDDSKKTEDRFIDGCSLHKDFRF